MKKKKYRQRRQLYFTPEFPTEYMYTLYTCAEFKSDTSKNLNKVFELKKEIMIL